MTRLAIALSILTFVLHDSLPSWRASITRSIHQQCLKLTPTPKSAKAATKVREVHQSLVCGKNLKSSDSLQNWKDLGLIHILVVSGGHLTILAKTLFAFLILIVGILNILSRRKFESRSPLAIQATKSCVFVAITALAVANQFDPPVLRAWLDHLLRPVLKRHGYQTNEISFVTTWVALPAIGDESDLISLGLSFFASVVVEKLSGRHHDQPLLFAFTLQTFLWWALLPFLIPLGAPHPLATLSNIILAPLLGAVLIPSALFCYMFGLQDIFPWVWGMTEWLIRTFASLLPDAAPAIHINGVRWTTITYLALLTMALALITRSSPISRWERQNKANWPIWLGAIFSMTLASAAHQILDVKKKPLSPVAHISKNETKELKKTKRGKVCIPYQAIEQRARNKHCRRRHSDL